MISNKAYLEDLVYFCTTPDGLEKRKQKTRSKNNLERHMKELEDEKSTLKVKDRYNTNIESCKAYVDTLSIVHNTSLECLISILSCGYILPPIRMERANVNYNWRIVPNRNIEHTIDYIYASPGKGDWLYGLYEIHLNPLVEQFKESLFIPRAELKLSHECIKEHLISLSLWRQYLAEDIAVNCEKVEDFIDIPVQLKPELLINGRIPVEFIMKIVCANQTAYDQLLHSIANELMDKPNIIRKIKLTYPGKGGQING